MTATHPPVLAIVGPTATGKTALALRLARRFPAEVVSADSRQVYRGMDIGTAKPTPGERAAVPHHLIDVADPDTPFSLAQYRTLALVAIADIRARGLLALLVGGTGLYVRTVTEGLTVPAVPPDLTFRTALEARASAEGAAALYAELRAADPEAVLHIEPLNLRRIIRALEVQRATGVPFSAQQRRSAPPFPVLLVGLTLPRVRLYALADQRVDRMMAEGLLDEVRGLHAAGYGWELPSMSGIGYRQLGVYLRGEGTLPDAVQRIKFDTHAFIRRQYTWFRKAPAMRWFDATDLDAVADEVAGLL